MTNNRTFRSRTLILAGLIALLTVSCATNPVTGRREVILVSEQQEVALGRQAHPQVIAQYGVYDEKPELNRLVERIGREIAADSDRPELPWTFTILDSPMVNAMALPGGFIYITRGMLERINSEDELAGVLGHEIAHVTARHAAQRISRAQLAQFGLVLGSVIAGPQATQQYGQIAELATALLFQRYSRSQETQADVVGTEYMAESGFNPTGAARMLMALQRLDKREATAIDRYFQSHPDPAKRVRDVTRKAEEILAASPPARFDPPDRSGYLRLIEGMITGNSTQHVTIVDGTVYDRDHGIILSAPRGWVATTAPGAQFILQPAQRGETMFVLQEVELANLRAGGNPQSAVRARLQQMGLQPVSSGTVSAATGERFNVDVWQGRTQAGTVRVETTQFVHGDHVAVLMFVSPARARGGSPMAALVDDMRIDVRRARAVEPPRIRVDRARRGESWAEIARRATGNPGNAEAVANMNGFNLNEPPPPGIAVKLPQAVIPEV